MILDQIKTYGLLAAAAVLAGLLTAQTLRLSAVRLELATVKTKQAEERQAAAAAQAATTAVYRQTEQNLRTVADQARKETNEQITALTKQRDQLRAYVHQLERVYLQLGPAPGVGGTTAATPDAGKAGAGGDGAGLHGPTGPASEVAVEDRDAQIDEAFRADLIRIHLLGCYRQYDAAQQTLKKLYKEH